MGDYAEEAFSLFFILMLIRLLLLIYVSGRAASLLQSHFNDSLTVGGSRCRKPNRSKITLYLQGHTASKPLCSLLMNIAFLPWLLFSCSLFIPFSSSQLFLPPPPIPFRLCESLGFKGAWGQPMFDQRWRSQRRGRQRRGPTQLHCEPEDCVNFYRSLLSFSSIHPLPCAPPTHW